VSELTYIGTGSNADELRINARSQNKL